MKAIRNHIPKKILAVGIITSLIVVIFLLGILLNQAGQTTQLEADTAKYEENSKEDLLQELYSVNEYLGKMEETVLTNQESLSTISGSNELFLNQSETLAQEILQIEGSLGDLHNRIVATQDELNILFNEMANEGEARQEETKEAFESVKESLTLIQTDFTAAHDEIENLLDEIKHSSDEKHSELLLLLDQMENEMGESFQTNLTLFMESIEQIEKNSQANHTLLMEPIDQIGKNSQANHTLLMESIDQMGESSQLNSIMLMESISQLSESNILFYDSLKNEMTNAFQNIGSQTDTLNSNLNNQYENLTTIVSTGNEDLRVYFDNIYGEVTQKLDSVFRSVSSGKRLLASALLTKGVTVSEDATFYEMSQAILRIPQNMELESQEMHGTVTYDYHYHEDANGVTPHTEWRKQMGGCYVIPYYHVHSGSSAGGGCYTTPIYHTHTGSSTAGGGCYTVVIAHTHNSSCPTKKVIANGGTATSCDGTFMYQSVGVYKCSRCGASSSSGGTCKAYNPHYETVYDCSKTVDGYNLGCGKTNSTIISYNLGCGKSESTVDYYNAGCGFTDRQISGVHIIYQGKIGAASMEINIPSETDMEQEEVSILENESEK